ncbi:MAG: PAS domain S-box protein [Bacteroidales bacterium]
MPEKTKKELLQELQELKQENETLQSSCQATTAAHRESMEKMRAFAWMLKQKHTAKQSYVPDYGDLSQLNKDGLIKKSINKDQLQDIVSEYLDLLETSAAIYEKNGDYALGIFSSGWCQLMDTASRKLCDTDDNREALESGRWLCHDSCWKDASTKAMREQKPADIACSGGIRLYAVPVMANNEVIGAINFGYGSPPKEEARLNKLSEKYKIPVKDLLEQSKTYNDRPKFVIDYAKNRLQKAAKQIGYLVERQITKEQLLQSEENLRITLNSIGDAVIATDLHERITRMNPESERLCGCQMEEVIGKRLTDVFHIVNAHTGEKADNPVKKVLETSGVVGLANHTKLIANDGNEYQIADSASPIKDKQGNISGVVLVFRDVTEEYTMHEKLQHSHDLMYYIVQHNRSAVAVHDRDLKYIYVSQKYLDDYKVKESEVIGKHHYEVFPDLPQKWREIHQKVLAGEVHCAEDDPFYRADGSVDWTRWECRPWYESDGSIGGIIVYTEVINEHKQREQELTDQKELLSAIYRNAPLVMMVVNAERRIQQVNGFAAQFAGRDAEEMLGLRGGEALRCLHVLDDPKGCGFGAFCQQCVIRNAVLDTLETGKTYLQSEAPYFYQGTDNQIKEMTFLTSTTPIMVKGERMVLVTLMDITKRKQAEMRLKDSEEKHRRLYETMSQGVIYQATDGSIISANPAAERVLGLSLDQMQGKTSMDPRWKMIKEDETKVPGKDHPSMIALRTGEKTGPVIRAVFAPERNEYVWLSITATPLFRPGEDKPFQVYAVFDDITEEKRKEDEIKQQQQLINTTFEKLPIGIAVNTVKPTLKAETINDKFAEIYGVSREALETPDSFWEVVYEDKAFREEIKNRVLSDMESGDPGKMVWEDIPITKNGKVVKYITAQNIPLDDKGLVISTVRDVTERKLAEQAVKESEKRFQKMLSLIPDMISIHDPDMNIVYSNWNGFAAVENDKRKFHTKCYKTYRGLDEICPDCHAKEVFTTKKPYQAEVGLPGGSWVDLRVIPILDKDGEIELFVEWVRDITEEKETEKTKQVLYQVANDILYNFELSDLIKAIERQLSKLVDTTNFYVALYDQENQLFSAPFEKDQKDHIETWEAKGSATGLVIDRKQSVLLKKQDVWRLIESGEIAQTGTMCESWLGVPILNGDAISGVIVIQSYENKEAFNDNTIKIVEYVSNQISLALERTRIFEDLLHAKNKAEESNRLKSAFLANMSHEIRTPMNGIMGFAELLENPQLSHDQQQDYIGIIKKSGVRMLNIINNIVDMARIEAGVMDIDLVETNINEQLEYIDRFFKPQVEAKDLQLNLITKLPDNWPNAITDREKLIAILTNLVKNALKYTKKGSIELGCEIVDTHGRAYLRFYIKDTGIGISKDRQEAIFERFVQADIEDKEAYQGAGLGLAISKAYVEMLGGQIWVESVEGKGSTFYFTIPYQGETEETSLEETFEPEQSETVATKTLKILIVEDDKMSAKLISAYVEALGKEILFAENGSDALETCKQHPDIDLILMDIKMPDMEGDEVTRHIRRFNKNVVIIAQTAKALTGDRAQAMQAGFDDYITKPINRAILLKSIEKIV